MRGTLIVQKINELPIEHLKEISPFTCCGLHLFGPFLVIVGRKERKWYAQYPLVSQAEQFIKCDNRTSLIGSESELKKVLTK